MSGSEELFSFVVPLAGMRLIVPRICVREIVSFRSPGPHGGHAPWLLGTIPWQGRILPLLSFEGACGEPIPEPGSRTRVAVLGALSEADGFALLTQGFPQLLRVNAAVLELDAGREWPEDAPVLCELRVVNERALIPDIERLEEMVSRELGTGAAAASTEVAP